MKLRCFPHVKAAQSLIPLNRRSGLWGTGSNACTHSCCPFVFRIMSRRSAHPRSAQTHFHESSRFSKRRRCRLVFGVVAFPPPPVTSPATRPKPFDLSGFCYPLAGPLHRARPVLIRALKEVIDLLLASLSASTWGVNRDRSRLPSLSNKASPLCSPLPWLVTCP